jgi:hypothetical protein
MHTFLVSLVLLSSSVAVFAIAGWVRSSAARRDCASRFVSQAEELARKTKDLEMERDERAKMTEEIQRCKDFIACLEPLMIKSAGDGADYGARYQFWEKTALLLWGQVRELSAEKQRAAILDLGYELVDALLSHVIPHRNPSAACRRLSV